MSVEETFVLAAGTLIHVEGRPLELVDAAQVRPVAATVGALHGPAAALGAKGGAAGRGEAKRRQVDYAALGRKGGAAGKGSSKARGKKTG